MSLQPRVVLVHRQTEYAELVARHGTRDQARFFLKQRGRDLDELESRHHLYRAVLEQVGSGIPVEWRRGAVERADVGRFLFASEDIVVVVGQDGLVANVAKYLAGQPVIGIDPEPGHNAGVLVTHGSDAVGDLLRHPDQVEQRTMVEALLDDGQRLLALNEVFVGHPSHQSARYLVQTSAAGPEHQSSSGIIITTGTGATGWGSSIARAIKSELVLPAPAEPRLLFFVREAWPSPATGTTVTEGELTGSRLRVVVESDRLVAFGDGMESDPLTLTFGQTLDIGLAPERLNLVR
jgi:hypothetical protein